MTVEQLIQLLQTCNAKSRIHVEVEDKSIHPIWTIREIVNQYNGKMEVLITSIEYNFNDMRTT